jgi:predicted transcriptional regulator
MKSVRLDPDLELRLHQASTRLGRSQSDVIRDAVVRYCNSVSADRLDLKLAPYLGAVHGGGGRARQTGRVFTKTLAERRVARRKAR